MNVGLLWLANLMGGLARRQRITLILKADNRLDAKQVGVPSLENKEMACNGVGMKLNLPICPSKLAKIGVLLITVQPQCLGGCDGEASSSSSSDVFPVACWVDETDL